MLDVVVLDQLDELGLRGEIGTKRAVAAGQDEQSLGYRGRAHDQVTLGVAQVVPLLGHVVADDHRVIVGGDRAQIILGQKERQRTFQRAGFDADVTVHADQQRAVCRHAAGDGAQHLGHGRAFAITFLEHVTHADVVGPAMLLHHLVDDVDIAAIGDGGEQRRRHAIIRGITNQGVVDGESDLGVDPKRGTQDIERVRRLSGADGIGLGPQPRKHAAVVPDGTYRLHEPPRVAPGPYQAHGEDEALRAGVKDFARQMGHQQQGQRRQQ